MRSLDLSKDPTGRSFADDEENLLEVALSCTDLATGLYHKYSLL